MRPHQVPQPVVRAMHPHLERGHGRAGGPRNLLVRKPFRVLQPQHLALLGSQMLERTLQCVRAFHLLVRDVRPLGRRKPLVRRTERPFLSLPAPLLREAAVAQNQEQPPCKLVRLAAVRQPIERPHQRVLHRILSHVPGAEHARRVARVAIAVAPHQDGVALYVARQHRPHDFRIRRLTLETQQDPPSPEVMQVMVEDRGVAGNQSHPKESLPEGLVTHCLVGTCGRKRYPTLASTVFMASCPTTRPWWRTDIWGLRSPSQTGPPPHGIEEGGRCVSFSGGRRRLRCRRCWRRRRHRFPTTPRLKRPRTRSRCTARARSAARRTKRRRRPRTKWPSTARPSGGVR